MGLFALLGVGLGRRLPFGFIAVLFLRHVQLVHLLLVGLAGGAALTLILSLVPGAGHAIFARRGLEQRLVGGLLGGDGGGKLVRSFFGGGQSRLGALHFLDGRVQGGVVAGAGALGQRLFGLVQRLLLRIAHHDNVAGVIPGGAVGRLAASGRRGGRTLIILGEQWRGRQGGGENKQVKQVTLGLHGVLTRVAPAFSCCSFHVAMTICFSNSASRVFWFPPWLPP